MFRGKQCEHIGVVWNCSACRNAYMRRWRKAHPLTSAQRKRDTASSYANVYQKRGKLIPQPCEVCGEPNVQKYHDNYSKPLKVRWLCPFHLRAQRKNR